MPTNMLFAYCDDGSLEVVADEAEARRQFDSADLESGVIRLFDSTGEPLTPVFPERSERKFLGMRVSDDRGAFSLSPSKDSDAESLRDAFAPSVVLRPNRWFKDLDEVLAHLATAPGSGTP
jgi:hypothetical protein